MPALRVDLTDPPVTKTVDIDRHKSMKVQKLPPFLKEGVTSETP